MIQAYLILRSIKDFFKPESSRAELRDANIGRMRDLLALAQHHQQKHDFHGALDLMAQAQTLWQPYMDMPLPHFSREEQHEMDVMRIIQLTSTAQRYKQERDFSGALRMMVQAQALWEPSLGLPMPQFSRQEVHDINIGRVMYLESIAKRYQQNGFFESACDRMARARALWEPSMGFPKPHFSPEELGKMVAIPSRWIPVSVSTNSVGRFKCRKVTSVTECSICLEDVALGGMETYGPSCIHRFHLSCMREWVKQSDTCPSCRRVWLQR
jgi:hypothetical protein